MATKKTETDMTPVPEIETLNAHQKLQLVRDEFYKLGAKKTGKNLHAEFMYFELEDIVPMAEPLFSKFGLLLTCTFEDGRAIACVTNVHCPEDLIPFSIPLVFIAEPGKFRMNEVQGVGAAVTYYRRYLYMLVLDLVESDGFDSQNGDKNLTDDTPAPAPAKAKKVSTEERKAIKEELTSEDGNADEEQIAELKKTLKRLMSIDPDQEEFVQSIALKTEGFKKISKSQYDALMKGLDEMIRAYAVEGEKDES